MRKLFPSPLDFFRINRFLRSIVSWSHHQLQLELGRNFFYDFVWEGVVIVLLYQQFDTGRTRDLSNIWKYASARDHPVALHHQTFKAFRGCDAPPSILSKTPIVITVTHHVKNVTPLHCPTLRKFTPTIQYTYSVRYHSWDGIAQIFNIKNYACDASAQTFKYSYHCCFCQISTLSRTIAQLIIKNNHVTSTRAFYQISRLWRFNPLKPCRISCKAF